jgi:hypothetical protein
MLPNRRDRQVAARAGILRSLSTGQAMNRLCFTGFIKGSLKEIQSWCLKGTTRLESPTAALCENIG